jgi:peptide/nickel transport system substrate-binding protein
VNTARTLRLILLACLLAGLLLGCRNREPTPEPTPTVDTFPQGTPTPEPTEQIVVLVADEVRTLEPYRMVNVRAESSLSGHLWDTLTFVNSDLELEPSLATSWRLINNFTWEFRLREGLTFHNGEPVNAQAVRFSIERTQSMPGSLRTFAHDTQLERIQILDEYRFRLVTGIPISNLAYQVSSIEILPPIYYGETDAEQLARAPIGSGPYQVTEWTPGEPVELTAVDTYWKGTPTWRQVVFESEPDLQARLQALRDGTATLVTDLEPTRAEEWDLEDARLLTIESTKRLFVGMHVQPDSPFADVAVRQALNYGTNVAQLTETWHKGHGQRYASWVNPPGSNVQLEPWSYDPGRARALLAQAGYPDGFVTTLHAPSGVYPEDVAIANAIAEQWGELGITVKVEVHEWPDYVTALFSDSPPPLFLLGLNSRADPLQDTRNLSVGFAFNPTGWENPSFEDAVRRAQSTFNENARARLLNEAQSIGYEEAPWVWLWRQVDFYGIAESLSWTPRADGRVYLFESESQ